MKISNIKIENFKGFAGEHDFVLPEKAALLGNNGKGKTSFMQALLYGLTGIKPDGDIINTGADSAKVTIALPNPVDGSELLFAREEVKGKPNKCYIDGKKTTQKELDKMVADVIGIPLENIKQVANGDVVAAMAENPDDLSSLLLKYLPKKLTIIDVLGFVEGNDDVRTIVKNGFPDEGITIDTIDAFEKFARDTRKAQKEALASKKAIRAGLPAADDKPGRTRAEIEADMNELIGIEAKIKANRDAIQAYNRALAARKEAEKKIADLDEQINAIAATRPDPTLKDKIREEGQKASESIKNLNNTLSAIKTSRNQLETTLKALNEPICPISPLITCHENKTVAIDDVTEAIEGLNSAEAGSKEELAKAEESLADANRRAEELTKQTIDYNKKISLMQTQIALKKALPAVPDKPEEMEAPADISTRKEQLQAEARNLDNWKQGISLDKDIKALTEVVANYEAVVKNFADKGPVRNGVVAMFLGVFEGVCNDICKEHRPEISFRFENDHGVVVLMDNGKGSFLPYASLSKGEEAFFLFVLMEMLNKLTGSGLLLLDELSVLDGGVFDKLLDIINDASGDFDHVLFTAVDHDDIRKSVTAHGIPELAL